MKDFIQAIISRLELKCPTLYVNLWNNQLAEMQEGVQMTFPLPAVFVEIINDNATKQLGNGVQLYDPLTVRAHVLHEVYNNETYFTPDFNVFDIKQQVYLALQKFEPTNACTFVRISETQDNEHANVTHFVLDFATNLMDFSAQEPRNPQTIQPPFTHTITTIIQ